MDPTDVVIIGEDRVMSNLILLNLGRRGYVAHWVPEAALGKCQISDDVLQGARAIILDISGHDGDAWRLAQFLRQQVKIADIPIILLSPAWPDQRRLAELAPCGWLRKPYAMANLVAEVERWLDPTDIAVENPMSVRAPCQ